MDGYLVVCKRARKLDIPINAHLTQENATYTQRWHGYKNAYLDKIAQNHQVLTYHTAFSLHHLHPT